MNLKVATEVSIPLSKRRIALIAFGGLAFVAIGVWLWIISSHFPEARRLVTKCGAAASIVFFGTAGGYSIFKLFDARPGLIIDAQGIVDNSSGVSAGRITWDEITGLSKTTVFGQQFITIHISDPAKFAARGNLLQRLIHRRNMGMMGSPISINIQALAIGFGELYALLMTGFAAYQRSAHSVHDNTGSDGPEQAPH